MAAELTRRTALGLGAALPLMAAASAPMEPEEDEWLILPSLQMLGAGQTKTIHENCYTIHHTWMQRVRTRDWQVQLAHVNSRAYRGWIAGKQFKDGVPPHIQFGGAVISGKGDPNFYEKWAAHARREFVES